MGDIPGMSAIGAKRTWPELAKRASEGVDISWAVNAYLPSVHTPRGPLLFDAGWAVAGPIIFIAEIMRGNVTTNLDFFQGRPTQTFEPGAVLLAEGMQSGALCILISGEVEVLKGGFQVNVVSDPGAFFGEMSILLNTPHTATVRALGNVKSIGLKTAALSCGPTKTSLSTS